MRLAPALPVVMNAGQLATARNILSNEKYNGDALLQKSFTPDFRHRRQVPNMGEVPQYYVTGAHVATISPAVWDFVQARQRHEELLQQHAVLLEQIQS